MKKPEIMGVQHTLVSVRSYEACITFYKDILGLNKTHIDWGDCHNFAMDMMRGSSNYSYAYMCEGKDEGIVIELVRMKEPTPRPIRKDLQYGDIGINKLTMGVQDVESVYKDYQGRIRFKCKPKSVDIPGWGEYNFVYGTDPDGNLIEFISGPRIEASGAFGGVRSLGVGVSDIERSLAFYREQLDFDLTLVDVHDRFSGVLGEITGSDTSQVKSCLIGNSNGFHMLELFEVDRPRGRSMPFNTMLGDYGINEIALMGTDIPCTASYFTEMGFDVVGDPGSLEVPSEDGWKLGWFMYVRDPDGLPVEIIGGPEGPPF